MLGIFCVVPVTIMRVGIRAFIPALGLVLVTLGVYMITLTSFNGPLPTGNMRVVDETMSPTTSGLLFQLTSVHSAESSPRTNSSSTYITSQTSNASISTNNPISTLGPITNTLISSSPSSPIIPVFQTFPSRPILNVSDNSSVVSPSQSTASSSAATSSNNSTLLTVTSTGIYSSSSLATSTVTSAGAMTTAAVGTTAIPLTTASTTNLTVTSTTTAIATTTTTSTPTNPNTTYYITANDMRNGRLGNQMFRYASLLGIATAQGRQLFIAPGSELEATFKLSHIGSNPAASGWRLLHEINANVFDVRLMNLPQENYRVNGFLQSHKYFDPAHSEVRHEFIFQDRISNEAAGIFHDLVTKYRGSLFVGVHVRRGDFLNQDKLALGYGAPEKSYFTKAFDWMKARFPTRNVQFLVASDDLNWVNQNIISDKVIALPYASPEVHLAILSSCDHAIISGGTYGWWGAWLAGGYCVYFTGYMHKGTPFGDIFNASDYYPSTWVGLDN